jgi:hypothetical protein
MFTLSKSLRCVHRTVITENMFVLLSIVIGGNRKSRMLSKSDADRALSVKG